MNRYEFCTTKDGSVGLYNNEVNDIYHSSYGALKESIQKFILASDFLDFVDTNKQVSILDICYGIGYNSKASLYLGKMRNKNIKIKIDALEIDQELIFISPFVKDTIPSLDLNLFLINQLSKNSTKFNEFIPEILRGLDGHSIQFFEPHMINFFKNNYFSPYKTSQVALEPTFLHNIYYQYISSSIKNGLNNSVYSDCSFTPYSEDARLALTKLDHEYNFIFLDAFTPQKDPTLWTLDFLSLIKSKMNKNSILITYSNSTPFRAALLNLNFHLGKVLINGKQFGTIASLNKDKIKNPLNNYDIGITNTTGGTFYRDPDFKLFKEEIITNRLTEKSISNKTTTTRYKKDYIKK